MNGIEHDVGYEIRGTWEEWLTTILADYVFDAYGKRFI
jgi:hypothetical protein